MATQIDGGSGADKLAVASGTGGEQIGLLLTRRLGQPLEAPSQVPNGTRIVARHPDGSVFEYMQLRT
jgi:hypothetical protein